MKSKPVRIYLADLGHTYYTISPSTLPIGIAYLKAHLDNVFGSEVHVSLFKYPGRLLDALKTGIAPDILGFGIYNWNENLSVEIATIARTLHPEALLCAGGLNIPDNARDIARYCLERHKRIFDIYVPYEGEIVMQGIVRTFLDNPSRSKTMEAAIPGCWRQEGGDLAGDNALPCIPDLSLIICREPWMKCSMTSR